ncbi:MAG TPA: hypothetical protein VMN56_05655 [Casimicrobiaceae bacterium]|nr:hypothetical protein [Casimicrobiaceae bacterium]
MAAKSNKRLLNEVSTELSGARPGWTHVKTDIGWPETWDRKIGDAWYTVERARNGKWCSGRSYRRGDVDYGVIRGVYHPSLEAAQEWCEADARTWGSR